MHYIYTMIYRYNFLLLTLHVLRGPYSKGLTRLTRTSYAEPFFIRFTTFFQVCLNKMSHCCYPVIEIPCSVAEYYQDFWCMPFIKRICLVFEHVSGHQKVLRGQGVSLLGHVFQGPKWANTSYTSYAACVPAYTVWFIGNFMILAYTSYSGNFMIYFVSIKQSIYIYVYI